MLWILPAAIVFAASLSMSAPVAGAETGSPSQSDTAEHGAGQAISLPWDESPGDEEKTTLVETVKLALERNLGLRASVQEVNSGSEQLRQARGDLLPSVEAGIRQTVVDQDRAEVSFGRNPEYRTSATLTVNQQIWSDRAHAAVQIQELLQKARESDRRKVALDTMLEASVAFVKLLRTRAFARIAADDLELTRSNYDRAQTRLELGVANKSEVYRWETRLASSKRELNHAVAEVKKAQVSLNEVVNRPLDQTFHPERPELSDERLLFGRSDIWEALQDDDRHRGLEEYWITEALLFAPELDAIRNERAAQYRELLAAKRKVRVPEVLLSIDATKHVSEEGQGTEELDFTIPGTDRQVGGTTDNFEWRAAITASLPLYAGGSNRAEIKEAQADSTRMDLLYDQALLAVRAGVLKNLAAFQASLKNIDLARAEAEAAENNLELIAMSYERGVVTIIDLLDAQVTAVSAQRSAANAVYDFLIDYMELQRTVGRFDVALSPGERAAARERLQPYLE